MGVLGFELGDRVVKGVEEKGTCYDIMAKKSKWPLASMLQYHLISHGCKP